MVSALQGWGYDRPRQERAWPGVGAALAALMAGVAHTSAFAPVEAWWLQVLALAALWALAGAARPARAAWLGWCFGLGWLTSGLWWLYISMHDHGDLPAPLAALAVLGLASALSLYYAAALAWWAAGRGSALWRRVPLVAACWLGAELARASWWTGFPWLAAGYAHTSGPLAGWAPWIGVYGIGALAAALAALLAHGLRSAAGLADGAVHRLGQRPRRGPAWAVGAAVVALVGIGPGLPASFTESTGRLSVSLVQPNVPQNLKFDGTKLDANLHQLAAAVKAAPGALVVTPESVVPLPVEQVEPAYWQSLQATVAAGGRAALVGVFLPAGDGRYINSMVAVTSQSGPALGRYDHYGKQHLLPFGEFIPPGFKWFVRAMAIPLDDQASGRPVEPFQFNGQRLRPLICYEDLFGEDFVASLVGPGAATVLVNASNLAWFGPVMVQDQHLQFSRMRALEFQRPVVRSTNTGATAIVDHLGRVTDRLPPEVTATLTGEVEGRTGETPYARWLGRWGLWPLWALAVLPMLLALAMGGSRRP